MCFIILNNDIIECYKSHNIIIISNKTHLRYTFSVFDWNLHWNNIFYSKFNILYKLNTRKTIENRNKVKNQLI